MSDFEKSLLVKPFAQVFLVMKSIYKFGIRQKANKFCWQKVGTYLFQNVFFFIVDAAWFSFDV